ncbi:acyl-CoA dehydrogenase family protein [Microbacterium sp. Kw_RZR3]|uniref:acyl-CoA dehydrogenase family protein n=1 Tax=unclassified Microbacterium TaxID=2609290 RepID=UPI0023DA0637|nr:acyl-CoA dehydrogenase family protein [Microbacterium sp. Kw_RZR3]MDF2046988.1 acyl-CoA dehydrogenase family protein [Microbacterium sp. Kw_RZR3]MDF2916083.1 putative acyl-CoA dehydrogenase [Microbacterium sp.]
MSTSLKEAQTMDAFFGAPGPDYDIVAKARAMQPLIREYAEQGEKNRRVADEVIEAMKDAGLLHISIPERWGGYGANFRTFIDAVSEIGRADGATGWVSALLNSSTWFATLFSEQAQEDVFGANPRSLVSAVLSPGGPFMQANSTKKFERVEGGIRVSGEWGYSTGSLYADWSIVPVRTDTDENGLPVNSLVLIPKSDATIRDTWHTVGMRGTGSNTLVVEDVFIPDHRIEPIGNFAAEQYPRVWAEEDNYHASFVPVAEIILSSVQIGMARGAIDLTIASGEKAVTYSVYQHAKNSVVHQIELAKAQSEADQAYFLAVRTAAAIDAAARDRRPMTIAERARARMDNGQAAALSRKAINRCLSITGAFSFAEINPLQRFWRNSETASRHALVHPEIGAEVYGKVLFGVEDPVQPF